MERRCQILSLDGGGVKGLFSAAVLAAMEGDLGGRIVDRFDLIVGTSTGGIIALGLGLGLRPEEIVDFYYTRCAGIFRNRLGWRSVRRLVGPKYAETPLQEALREVFGDRLLGDSMKRLVIPAYSLSEDGVYIFKTDHAPRLKRDWRVPAWQVALATSAAPTYFKPSQHVAKLRHVDGGLWANNPVMVGIAEAVSVLRFPLSDIRVLSLGTTNPVCRRPSSLDAGGILAWAKPAMDVFLRAQSLAATNLAMHLVGEGNIVRIDPAVPEGVFGLDTPARRNDLMAKAAYESRIYMPKLEARLGDYQAAEYIPEHRSARAGSDSEEEVDDV